MGEAFWRLCLLKLGSSLPSREKDERTSPFCKLLTPFMDHSSLRLQHPLGSRADFYPDTCGQTVWPAAAQVHSSLQPLSAYLSAAQDLCVRRSFCPSLHAAPTVLCLFFSGSLFSHPLSCSVQSALSLLLSRYQLYPIIFTSLAITQSAHLGKAEQTRGNGANCRCSAHYH